MKLDASFLHNTEPDVGKALIAQKISVNRRADVFYEIDTPLVPATQWPKMLIELALSRGLAEYKLLRNTGIFYTDLTQANFFISPQQALQLIRNTQKYLPNRDISFLLGQQLFYGYYGAASHRLAEAKHLDDALEIMLDQQALMSTLLDFRLSYEGERLVIYWQDCCGAQETLSFLVEMMSAAINALCNWRTGRALPWQFYFAQPTPDYIEQHQVHLDGNIAFNCQTNAMAITREFLYLPWQIDQHIKDTISAKITTDAIEPTAYRQGFLSAVYCHLHNNIQSNPNLEQTAAAFGMSSATFKRKLKKHHSHFQAQYDSVRKDLAIYWLHHERLSNEQIAHQLHFHDVANLRRAFKKWTGLTPQAMRS